MVDLKDGGKELRCFEILSDICCSTRIVKFHTYADAKHAVDTMNGLRLHNSAFPLEVRFDRK